MDFARVFDPQLNAKEAKIQKKKYISPAIRLMKEGDLIITYERHDSMDHLYLIKDQIYGNKFGAFHHNDFIGKPFGSKITCRSNNTRWVYALEPSPELWSAALHTRTQIVNDLDTSFILMNLDIFSGCTVVESGTGSGCFSNALARAVYPHGHVFTYEYNTLRAHQAEEEFKKLGLSDVVTVQCRDVCAKFDHDGGGFLGVPSGSVDAVFLDLPEPWLAVGHAADVLKPGRNICTYSPCIEQVIRTCEELRKVGFHSIHMYEVRHRPFDGRGMIFENANLGRGNEALTNATNATSSSSSSSGGASQEQTESRVDQANSGVELEQSITYDVEDSDMKERSTDDKDDDNDEEEEDVLDDNDDGGAIINKKRKINDETASIFVAGAVTSSNDQVGANNNIIVKSSSSSTKWKLKREDHIPAQKHVTRIVPPVQLRVARPLTSMQGHTAFLTFALAPTEKI